VIAYSPPPLGNFQLDFVPSINIYRPAPVRVPSQTLHILSPLHPASPNRKTFTTGADEARRDLLNADVGYTHLDGCVGRDDFLLVNPLHRHLFSWLTHYLLSASLLVGMDNRRSRGVNIVASKVENTSPTPLDNIVSFHHS
jgi:hypothetical protein